MTLEFDGPDGNKYAFNISKGGNPKMTLYDTTGSKRLWEAWLSLGKLAYNHDGRVQIKWVDPGKDPEHPSGLYAIIDGSMWCDLYLGRY